TPSFESEPPAPWLYSTSELWKTFLAPEPESAPGASNGDAASLSDCPPPTADPAVAAATDAAPPAKMAFMSPKMSFATKFETKEFQATRERLMRKRAEKELAATDPTLLTSEAAATPDGESEDAYERDRQMQASAREIREFLERPERRETNLRTGNR